MRPPLDVKTFRTGIEEDMSRAYKLISDLEHWSMTPSYDDAMPSEEQEATEMELHDVLTRIHERVLYRNPIERNLS